MLILSRYLGQKLRVGNDIEVTIVRIDDGQVRLGIVAPKSVSVHREEVYERIKCQAASPKDQRPVPVSFVNARRRISHSD